MGSHDPVGTRRVGARHYSDKSRRLADNRIGLCIHDIYGFVVTVGQIVLLKDRIEPADVETPALIRMNRWTIGVAPWLR